MGSTDLDKAEEIELNEECDLLEEVYVYLTEKKYKEGLTQNQKCVIRKKAANFCIVNGEMIFKKKLRGTKEV